MRNIKICILFVLFFSMVSFAGADTVFFKSGDKVEGIITGDNGKQVEIKVYMGESSMTCTYDHDCILRVVKDEEKNRLMEEDHNNASGGDAVEEDVSLCEMVPVAQTSSGFVPLILSLLQIVIPITLIPVVLRLRKNFFGLSWAACSVILAVIMLSGVLQLYMYYYRKVRYQMHSITLLLEEQKREYQPVPSYGTVSYKTQPPDYSYLEVDPVSVENIYFSIGESYGAIKGYVIFTDEDGKQCATYGTLSLSRNRKEYATNEEGYEYVLSDKTIYLESINFTPSDFEYRSGRARLPFTVSPSSVKNGDVIELEWGRFRKKRTLWMHDLRE